MTNDVQNESNVNVSQDEQARIKELNEKIQLLEKRVEEYLNGWKRAKADYINLKKEIGANQKTVIEFALAASVAKFLPVFDNLDTALKHLPQNLKDSEWTQGIGNIKKQFEGILQELGIEKIKTVGEKFNPEFHEAVIEEKKDGVEPGVIFEEIKAGYMLGGKTFIAAKVKVAK